MPSPVNQTDPETDLARRAVGGDEAALETLLVERHQELFSFLDRRLVGAARGVIAVEDLLQQTYLQAFKSIAKFEPRGPGAFSGWLKRIAQNKLIDATRRSGREPRAPKPTASPGESGYSSLMGVLADSCANPSGEAMAEELRDAFRLALASLPDNYRLGLQLRYLEGLPLEEVAQRLDTTPDAARGVCHRARKALREEIMRLSRYV